MRKLLAAVCIVSGFALVTDVASARPRLGGTFSSKPAAAVKAPQRLDAKAATDRPSPPRTWVVAVPRAKQQPAPAQSALDEDAVPPLGAFAASAGANDIGAAPSSPPPVKAAAPEPQAPAKPPQHAKPADVAPVPAPAPKRVAAAPQQPRVIALCYWNRAGQCVP